MALPNEFGNEFSIGELTRWSWGIYVVRAGGGVIALIGLGFLTGAL